MHLVKTAAAAQWFSLKQQERSILDSPHSDTPPTPLYSHIDGSHDDDDDDDDDDNDDNDDNDDEGL